ncbi:DUF4862 family protein [Devriesea agamarum]|uniref:DUF4862 family protein n=1 Tax=Devriesea agamarum TaxID=472569 RepID=UPI00071C5328|nr:DUF4862 family protein [Devriesea agamarum]
MSTRPLVVGAYAALPATPHDQDLFYTRLAERQLATALEIPFKGYDGDPLTDGLDHLAGQVRGRFVDSVITLIPGTMMRVGTNPTFGLASVDPEGRAQALDLVRRALSAADGLRDRTGENSVAALHVHSAPSVTADREAFARSLEDLLPIIPDGIRLIVEHCDAYDPKVTGEKRFLTLDDEIEVVRGTGIGITINWGRSALEAHDADRPRQQIAQLVAEGLLEGVMFSGAGPDNNAYGVGWADLHLPLAADEPTSLMDAEVVAQCLAAAGGTERFSGAKIQVPADSDVEGRLDVIASIIDAIRSASR